MGKRGPKAKGLDAAAERQIGELSAQGIPAQEIATRLGLSERTVSRRVAALRGPVKPRPGSPAPSSQLAPTSASWPDVAAASAAGEESEGAGTSGHLPTDEELEEAERGGPSTIDGVVKDLAIEYRNAPRGPLKFRASEVLMKALEIRRKATPPPKPDLNEHPDFVALGRTVAERLHKMVDLVAEDGRQG